MWINLLPEEPLINLDLNTFNDLRNDDWEYLFHLKPTRESDSVSDSQISLISNISKSENVSSNAEPDPTSNINIENRKNEEENDVSNPRNLNNQDKLNIPGEQGQEVEVGRPGTSVNEFTPRRSRLGLDIRVPVEGGRNQRISKKISEVNRLEIQQISDHVREVVMLMETPQSWVSKLEVDYRDYIRGEVV